MTTLFEPFYLQERRAHASIIPGDEVPPLSLHPDCLGSGVVTALRYWRNFYVGKEGLHVIGGYQT